MARFIEEEEKTEELVNEPSSDTQIYTMKSQIGHERTASERLADRVRRSGAPIYAIYFWSFQRRKSKSTAY